MPEKLSAIERRALLGDNIDGLRLMRETEFWQAWERIERKKRGHQRRQARWESGSSLDRGATGGIKDLNR